jgi:hypothetical protein
MESAVNHSLTQANGSTHAKIALLAVAASLVFVAVVSAANVTRQDAPGARVYGPVVKATTTVTVAKTGASVVR